MALFNRPGKAASAAAAANSPRPAEGGGAVIKPRRVADDGAVQRAREAYDGSAQQLERLRGQLAEALERHQALNASALECEQRGENVMGPLADAQRQAATLADLIPVAERGKASARAALTRALDDAQATLKPEYLRHIVAQLDELESVLWQALGLQRRVHEAVGDALAEGINVGISEAAYWSAGFPGFPSLRSSEEIKTWLRNRSIAPK
jgi:hypothetical protein